MKKSFELSAADREFFILVSRAAFSNPFGDERLDADLAISGMPESASRVEVLERALGAVGQRVENLEARGGAHLALFSGADRELVRIALLFDVFHRHMSDFDALIAEQVEAGPESCRVRFAADAVGLMVRRGFSRREAERFFAVFYQMRRAFYFVARSLVGHCQAMKQLRKRLWSNVFTHDIRWYDRYLWDRMEDFSTLLLGETGTGKGAAAAAIGRSGFIPLDTGAGTFKESFTRNFISINLSQYPETLIESELFGHRKGAFTGAIEHHEGVLSRCSPHGAIFLDEIGDASVPVQIKLLEVLQDRTFSPVGSHEKLMFRGRVIAATNRGLDRLRGEGRFRDDFFYRLCTDIITVPPLRQRLAESPAELDELLEHILRRLLGAATGEMVADLRRAIDGQLDPEYPWPGNVRELEQAVRRILLTGEYRGDLKGARRDAAGELHDAVDQGGMSAQDLVAAYCRLLHARCGSYSEVARRVNLDRRTVKKHVGPRA